MTGRIPPPVIVFDPDYLREHDAAVRADEREKIAQAIAALNVSPNAAGDYQRGWEIVRDIAARIARNGGQQP